jgi:hypothetical protein
MSLLRGRALGLPSGEAVAAGSRPSRSARAMSGSPGPGLERGDAALVLRSREADVCDDGDRLGPVGGHIVAEVLIGIIEADPESFPAIYRNWTPTLADGDGSDSGLGRLLDRLERAE